MPELPVLPGREVCRALIRAGFVEKSQKGSHVKMTHPDGRIVIAPLHRRDLALGTLRSILRQARLSAEEFRALL